MIRKLLNRFIRYEVICRLRGHRITGRARIGSKGRYELSYCSRCKRNIREPLKDTREVEVVGWHSVVQPIPGVKAEDVIAFRRRWPRWRRDPHIARGLIVDERGTVGA